MLKPSKVVIDGNSVISLPESITTPIRHAVEMIRRDHNKVSFYGTRNT